MNGTWFKIKGYKYTSPHTVEFSEPFDPPVEPCTWHLFKCTDVNGINKTQEYPGKFDPVGVGELVRPGIRVETKAQVDSGNWFWQARKIQ